MSTLSERSTVHFCEEELELAQLFKAYGLPWRPTVGHFVLDQSQLIEQPSPFQPGVYFILDLKHFLRRSGSIDELIRSMCWLPTWEQSRSLLRELGVGDAAVARRLQETGAVERGEERLELYRLTEESLTGGLGL